MRRLERQRLTHCGKEQVEDLKALLKLAAWDYRYGKEYRRIGKVLYDQEYFALVERAFEYKGIRGSIDTKTINNQQVYVFRFEPEIKR